MQCPIARSLARVGEWWSILILRDAFQGLIQFEQFRKSLGIAPNTLTRRLNTLVENGLLERRPYRVRPARDDYVLTERGRDIRPVLRALAGWGNTQFAAGGHRDRGGVPAAGGQSSENRVSRRHLIEIERLGVELCGEREYSLLVDVQPP